MLRMNLHGILICSVAGWMLTAGTTRGAALAPGRGESPLLRVSAANEYSSRVIFLAEQLQGQYRRLLLLRSAGALALSQLAVELYRYQRTMVAYWNTVRAYRVAEARRQPRRILYEAFISVSRPGAEPNANNFAGFVRSVRFEITGPGLSGVRVATTEGGRLSVPDLIEGATYRYRATGPGYLARSGTFVARSPSELFMLEPDPEGVFTVSVLRIDPQAPGAAVSVEGTSVEIFELPPGTEAEFDGSSVRYDGRTPQEILLGGVSKVRETTGEDGRSEFIAFESGTYLVFLDGDTTNVTLVNFPEEHEVTLFLGGPQRPSDAMALPVAAIGPDLDGTSLDDPFGSR